MSSGTWTKVAAKTAAEVCERFKLEKKAQPLLRAGQTPPEFVETLVQAGQYEAVFAFLANALPKREAIWWGCLAVRHTQGTSLPPKELAALHAVVAWVLDPSEPRRRAARAAGEAAEYGTPAGCATLAVVGTGGSLIAPELPVVAPEPTMTAKAVVGCLRLATVQGELKTLRVVQRELVELGISIAEGKTVWQSEKKAAPQRGPIPSPTASRRS